MSLVLLLFAGLHAGPAPALVQVADAVVAQAAEAAGTGTEGLALACLPTDGRLRSRLAQAARDLVLPRLMRALAPRVVSALPPRVRPALLNEAAVRESRLLLLEVGLVEDRLVVRGELLDSKNDPLGLARMVEHTVRASAPADDEVRLLDQALLPAFFEVRELARLGFRPVAVGVTPGPGARIAVLGERTVESFELVDGVAERRASLALPVLPVRFAVRVPAARFVVDSCVEPPVLRLKRLGESGSYVVGAGEVTAAKVLVPPEWLPVGVLANDCRLAIAAVVPGTTLLVPPLLDADRHPALAELALPAALVDAVVSARGSAFVDAGLHVVGTGIGAARAVLADLDGDGAAELVVSSPAPPGSPEHLVVYGHGAAPRRLEELAVTGPVRDLAVVPGDSEQVLVLTDAQLLVLRGGD